MTTLTATKPTYTYQDYLALDAPDGKRYELINGELIMVASPNRGHQIAVGALGTRMYVFADDRELGMVFFSPFDVILSDGSVVQPDLLFVSKEREEIITPANIRGAPDLVVEILSPSSIRRDWDDKLKLYSEHGVREYWIVDPMNRVVHLLLARGGDLAVAGVFGMGDTALSSVLAGFSVKVDDIF